MPYCVQNSALPAHYTDTFATFYDRYYTGWVQAIAPRLVDYLSKTHTSDRSLLDLCCGTGRASLAFCEAGWRVVGLDLSDGMLSLAQQRLQPMIDAGKAQLIHGSAARFDPPQRVGACICLDGALNHLDSFAELQSCFQSVSAALLDGGQFFFDLLEPAHFAHWHHVVVVDEPDSVIVRRGVWDEASNTALLRISGAFDDAGAFRRVSQTLRSRAFTAGQVQRALEAANLSLAACEFDIGPCCPVEAANPPANADLAGRRAYRAVKTAPLR